MLEGDRRTMKTVYLEGAARIVLSAAARATFHPFCAVTSLR